MLNHLTRRAGPRRLPAALASALQEDETVILMIFGTGAEPDRTEQRCRSLADDPGFESLRVVRVEDRATLAGAIPAAWLVPGRPATLLGPDRRMAVPLDATDGVELFVAVSALADRPARLQRATPVHAAAMGGV
jgi:hypothetical protein